MTDKKWGGAGRGQGRKQQWYGKTKSLRVPVDWIEGLKHCMANEIPPIFDIVHKQVDKERKQVDRVHNQVDRVSQSKYSDEFKQKAVDLLNAGMNASAVCSELERLGYTPILNKKNASRTLKRWLIEKG